eukprot:c4132_g1_i1.p1 GENE.c4132_g1_i1~~c4132_g1_i1.p1  ORF type:complete len:495 (+),score=128.16 c4132_g1_i1:123-1487(+)
MTSLTLSTENEVSAIPFSSSKSSFLSLISLVAPSVANPDSPTRAAIDLVAVLDRSGSMGGDKMKMLHRTVELLIQHMKDDDRLALVSYDDFVETPLPLTKMDTSGKALAKQALKLVTERGCTNLSGGLFQGLELLAQRQHFKNEVSSVLLMTDGLANAGVTNRPQLVDMTQRKIALMRNPTSVYTFGFGSDHDATLLGQIADAGRGNYYFMQTPDSIPQAFAGCIGGLMSVFAQNIEMTITATDGIIITDVITMFPKVANIPNKKYTIVIGDIFSEERKDILVDLQLPPHAGGPTDQHVLLGVELKYFDITALATQHLTAVAALQRTVPEQGIGQASLRVDEQRNRVVTAQAMQQATKLGEQGHIEQARGLLERCRLNVLQSASATTPQSSGLVSDLVSVEQNMQSRSQFLEVAHKQLNSKSRKHWVQRSAECDDKEVDSYTTVTKTSMRNKFK